MTDEWFWRPGISTEIEALRARAERAEAEAARLREALEELRKTAALLHQNAVGCAVHHYGHDFVVHGLPGWLHDTEATIARAALAGEPRTEPVPATDQDVEEAGR